MTKKLLQVAEAVMDSAAEEYREANLSSIESVQDYAENGMGIVLNDAEAQKILSVCRHYNALCSENKVTRGCDHYYEFEALLEDASPLFMHVHTGTVDTETGWRDSCEDFEDFEDLVKGGVLVEVIADENGDWIKAY